MSKPTKNTFLAEPKRQMGLEISQASPRTDLKKFELARQDLARMAVQGPGSFPLRQGELHRNYHTHMQLWDHEDAVA